MKRDLRSNARASFTKPLFALIYPPSLSCRAAHLWTGMAAYAQALLARYGVF